MSTITLENIKCNKCHKEFTVKLEFTQSLGYIRKAIRCPYCGALYHVKIDLSIIHIDITKKDLDEFEEWLLKEKNLISARQYRRQVEKYLETGILPKKLTALDHFQEFLRKKKNKNIIFPFYLR